MRVDLLRRQLLAIVARINPVKMEARTRANSLSLIEVTLRRTTATKTKMIMVSVAVREGGEENEPRRDRRKIPREAEMIETVEMAGAIVVNTAIGLIRVIVTMTIIEIIVTKIEIAVIVKTILLRFTVVMKVTVMIGIAVSATVDNFSVYLFIFSLT